MVKLLILSFKLIANSALLYLFFSSPTTAQITPDVTLPVNSSVTSDSKTSTITGGTRAGSNLFHSFEQFSVPTGSTAYFNNALDIQNIISRVTGSYISNIDGLIQANGTANLFLLNSNGIIFGPNAQLSIGGSFIGSTANSLKFADNTQFSATAHPTTPLLTISVPHGLQYGASSGSIVVQGNGRGTRVTTDLIDTTVGLRVQPNQTLALVGGKVALDGGTLKTAGGRIELGSVAGPGLVNLNPTEKGFSLSYEGVAVFGNIQLSQLATVDASGVGGGDVQIRGSQLSLFNGSQIEASTLRGESGGTLNITTSDLVELIGESEDGRFISGIATQVYPGAVGSGGNITIATGRLLVQGGAQISAGTYGAGNAGSLDVRTSNSVEVIGTTVDLVSSGLFSQVSPGATGSGGNLKIETARLIVRDGGFISSGTSGRGSAGSLSILARDSVELSGTPTGGRFGSAISTSVEPRATGDGGNLILETQRLILQGGATVSSATFGRGQSGSLLVRAKDSIELIGTSDTGIPSALSARSRGTGNAGNLTIEAGQLSVQDGARVTVSSLGSGTAGSLEINARKIYLNNQGKITAETVSGQGGNIALQVQDSLLMRNNSSISTSAGNQGEPGNGGDITIKTNTLVGLENSDITANAFKGRGGNVQVNAEGLFGIKPRSERTSESDITASSELGIDGVVEINTLNFDPVNGLVILPAEPVDVTGLIAQGCPGSSGNMGRGSSSEFIITGRGGLPPYQPGEPLSAEALTVNGDSLETGTENRLAEVTSKPSTRSTPLHLVEAQGWVFNSGV